MSGIIGAVGVAVTPDAENFWRRFKEQTQGQAEEAGREAGAAFSRGLATERPEIRIGADTSEARRELAALRAEIAATSAAARVSGGASGGGASGGGLGPLVTAAVLLGPALVPIAGGLAALTAGAVGLGVAGVLAFKGIEAELQKNSKAAVVYGGDIGQVKNIITGLQSTVAKGILPGFDQAVSKLQASVPQLNSSLAQSSTILGSITSHLVGGLVGGFRTFAPLIQQSEGYINHLAASFEAWATGPGGAHFASVLSHDLTLLVPALSNLTTTAVHLVQAFAPIGSTILTSVTALSHVLNSIPVPLLQAAAIAFVAFTAASKTAALLGPASAALRTFAAASGEAAAASGARSLSGALALGASRLIPYVAVYAGLAIGAKAASDATQSWRDSQDHLTNALGQSAKTISDIATLHWTSLGADFRNQAHKDLLASQAEINNALSPAVLQKKIADSQAAFSQTMAVYAATVRKAQGGLVGSAIGSGGSSGVARQIAGQLASLSAISANTQYYQQEAKLLDDISYKYSGSVARINIANENYVIAQIDRSGSISTATQAFASLDKSLNANIATEQSWTDASKGQKVTIDGVTYSQKAFNAALAQTGGDTSRAIAVLRGHSQALALDKLALQQSHDEQVNLSTAVGEAEGRYKLTAAQVDLYSAALGINASKVADGTISADTFATALGAVKDRLNLANTANAEWLASVDQFSKSGKTAADTASLLGAALKAGRGYALSFAGANLTAADATETAGTTLAQYSASISANGTLLGQLVKTSNGYRILQPQLTKGSLAIASALTQQATSAQTASEQTYQNEVATKGAKVAAQDALGVYQGYRAELIRQATQSGLTAGQAQALADKYLGIPKDVTTFIKQLGAGTVQGAIGNLTTAINNLSKNILIALNINGVDAAISQVSTLRGLLGSLPGASVNALGITHLSGGGGFAEGGLVRGAGTSTSDSIHARLSDQEFVVNAAATARNLPLLESINKGVKGFAAGGLVNPASPAAPQQIYVQNPFTGEYLLARVADVAADGMAGLTTHLTYQ